MTRVDPETGIVAYLHCARCLNENEWADISVGVSPEGDLIIWCNRHGEKVTRMLNETVAHDLMLAAGMECAHCHKKGLAH